MLGSAMAAGQAAQLYQGQRKWWLWFVQYATSSPSLPPKVAQCSKASPINHDRGTMSLRADTGPKGTKPQRVSLTLPALSGQGHFHPYI